MTVKYTGLADNIPELSIKKSFHKVDSLTVTKRLHVKSESIKFKHLKLNGCREINADGYTRHVYVMYNFKNGIGVKLQ